MSKRLYLGSALVSINIGVVLYLKSKNLTIYLCIKSLQLSC
jgi:hypothetical protein